MQCPAPRRGRVGRSMAHLATTVLLLLSAVHATVLADDEVWVRVDRPSASQLAAFPGLADYGGFAWGAVSVGELQALRSSGAAIRILERPFELHLGGLSFDPLTAYPRLESGGHHHHQPGSNFRLIQFDGPVRNEWLQGVRAQGIEIIQYIHPYTYVVWADQAQLGAARNANGVRWAGEFATEFRVIPEQRGFTAPDEATMLAISRYADERTVRRQIEAAGGEILAMTPYTTHFNLVKLIAPGERYLDLGRIPAVYTVQRALRVAPRGEMRNQSIVDHFPTNQDVVTGYADWLSDTGYDGSGVIVSVIDGGIRETHQDLVGNISPCVSDGSPTSCTTSNNDHGTHVAGAIAGTGASGSTDSGGFLQGQGVAPGASVVQQRYASPGLAYGFGNGCSDDPYCLSPDGALILLKEAALSGAVLANNSWGATGTGIGYDLPSQQIDAMVRDANPDQPGHQSLLPVWAILNGGGDGGGCNNSSLSSPDEAKNIFGIGSTELRPGSYPGGIVIPNPSDLFGVSANSAHGLACDGRQVPQMVAPGCGTLAPTGASDSAYNTFCGTSMAAPTAAGAAAVFFEYYQDQFGAAPSPALIKAAFTAAAVDLEGHTNADGGVMGHRPDRFQGYGRIDLDAVVNAPVNVMYFDQEEVFEATGDEWSLPLIAQDPNAPVRIMLTWTDAQGHGLAGTTPAWVNDLDLVVEAGSGTYLGNQIGADGYSQAGGAADGINNMEAVYLHPDQHSGSTFDVTVLAANISGDALNPHTPDPSNPTQDFALVCYNCDFGDPTFRLELQPETAAMCVPASGSEDLLVDVTVGVVGDYTGTVALSTAGEPAGVSSVLDPVSVAVPGASAWTLTVDSTAAAGTTPVLLVGDDGDEEKQIEFLLTLDQPLAGPDLSTPADQAQDVDLQPAFTWEALPGVDAYRIQVATDDGFGAIVIDEMVDGAAFSPEDELATGTVYYWRVQGSNTCDNSWSEAFEFQTRFEPVAEISPLSFSFALEPGDSDSDTLAITNAGTGNLVWSIETDSVDAAMASRGFQGYFEIDNWTLDNSPAGVGGSFTTESGPPVELTVIGGNNGVQGDTDFWIEIPQDGEISFDWGYQSSDTGDWDSGGYVINGTYTELADNASQVPFFESSATVAVSAGDIFAFRVHTRDGTQGAGNFGVTQFEFMPDACGEVTPADWLSVDSANGSTPGGDTDPVTVTVDTGGLAVGVHEGYLCVTTNDPAATLVPVPVTLDVLGDPPEDPVADVTPAAFEFELPAGTGTSDTLHIGNIGDGQLAWSIEQAEPAGYPADPVRVEFSAPVGAPRGVGVPPVNGIADAVVLPLPQGGAIVDDWDEGFEDIGTLPGAGWAIINNSDPLGEMSWFQGSGDNFPAHAGPTDSYISANFQNGAAGGVISSWLLTPEVLLQNGTELRFWTRHSTSTTFPDRMQVRLSTAGDSIDVGTTAESVGDFDLLLEDINEEMEYPGYPEQWTEFVITVAGLEAPTSGRFAFRYYSPDWDAVGSLIGVDTLSVTQPEGDPEGCDAPLDVPWLSVDPDSGSTTAGDSTPVSVMVDTAGLAEGDYQALLCVLSDDPANPQIEVPVALTVTAAGELPIADIAPAAFAFEVPLGGSDSDLLNIGNSGEAELVWSIEQAEHAGYASDPVHVDFHAPAGYARGVDAPVVGPVDTVVLPLPQGGAVADDWDEGFEDIGTLPGAGWALINNSTPDGLNSWFQGNPPVFEAHEGSADSYIAANFNAAPVGGTLSLWLLTPEVELHNGTTLTFWSRSGDDPEAPGEPNPFPDRLQVRLSTAGDSTDVGADPMDVGDFTELLLEINEAQTVGGYPIEWTQYTVEVSGLSAPATGRIAFRYFIPDTFDDGNFIGIDTVSVTQPEPGMDGCDAPVNVPWLSVDPDSGTTPAGGSVPVDVSVDSDGLAEGIYEALLCVTTNDPAAALVEVPVSLTVTAASGPGELEVAPDPIDFGQVGVGISATAGFTLTNIAGPGAAGVELVAFEILHGDAVFAIAGSGSCEPALILAPGDSCTIDVTFAPDAIDTFVGAVRIETAGGEIVTPGLAGEGVEPSPGDDEIFTDRFQVNED